jgi:hypothetical protein
MRSPQHDEALSVHDSAAKPEVTIYVNARDGTDARQGLTARGVRVRTLSWCAEHFVAHGVCVDCTQEAGEIVYAS